MSQILQSRKLTIALIAMLLYCAIVAYAMALDVIPHASSLDFLKAIVFTILGAKIQQSVTTE